MAYVSFSIYYIKHLEDILKWLWSFFFFEGRKKSSSFSLHGFPKKFVNEALAKVNTCIINDQ